MHPSHRLLPTLTLTLASVLLLFFQACAGPEAVPAPGDDVAAASTQPGTNGIAFVPPGTVAGGVLAAAMTDARATDRLLFVHSGADW